MLITINRDFNLYNEKDVCIPCKKGDILNLADEAITLNGKGVGTLHPETLYILLGVAYVGKGVFSVDIAKNSKNV